MGDIQFGLIIQGSAITYGDGPNNNSSGYDSKNAIDENINNFLPHIDQIVLSTWQSSNIDALNASGFVHIIKSPDIQGWDYDNQKKQFTSCMEGLLWLKKNTDVTHVIKIRTDMIVPKELVGWLTSFFNRNENQEKIVVSDILKNETFYMGDFIFAGAIARLEVFFESVLTQKNMHPINAADYVTKYIKSFGGSKFPLKQSRLIHTFWVANRNSECQTLWRNFLISQIQVIPLDIFKNISWRGKKIDKVLSNIDQNFSDSVECYVSSSMHQQRSLISVLILVAEQYKRYLKSFLRGIL